MDMLEKRLINIGYDPQEAADLCAFYQRQGDLDGLESYIITKESIEQSLSEIL